MTTRPNLFFLIPALALLIGAQPAPARSRTDRANWDNLQHLTPGAEIRVALADGKSAKGQFRSVTGDSLVIGQETLDRPMVTRVWFKRENHRRHNVMAGLRIGLLTIAAPTILVGAGAAVIGANAGEIAGIAALGAGMGAGIGSGAGALIPTGRWQEVYRAP